MGLYVNAIYLLFIFQMPIFSRSTLPPNHALCFRKHSKCQTRMETSYFFSSYVSCFATVIVQYQDFADTDICFLEPKRMHQIMLYIILLSFYFVFLYAPILNLLQIPTFDLKIEKPWCLCMATEDTGGLLYWLLFLCICIANYICSQIRKGARAFCSIFRGRTSPSPSRA